MISGQIENIGEILYVNNEFCKIFGYSKNNILGKNVNKIMSECISIEHDQILISAQKRSELAYFKAAREIYGLHKNGYLIRL
jgi:PAS domain S-box-containing protein